MRRNLLYLTGMGLVVSLLNVGLCFGGDETYESQQALRMGSRVEQLEKEVAELKAGKSGSGANVFSWRWDKGLKFQTADGNFKLALGGRLMYDFKIIDQDDENKAAYDDVDNLAEVRRLRLEIGGDIYEDAFFKIQLDFAGGEAALKDVYLGYKHVPVFGHIRVGHQKEPMGLDQITSSKYITFIERAMPIEAFTPERNLGVMVYDTALNDRMTWAVGVFRDADEFGTSLADDGGAVTARLTGTPYITEKGDKLLHLGASVSYREVPDDTARFRTRPEWHGAPRFADTHDFMTDSVTLYGLEAALVLGPFDVQAEALGASTDAGDMSGWYIQGGYWLTGEHKKYDREEGAFGRVSPKQNFSPSHGTWGGWQVNARYSSVDMNDGSLAGGQVDDVTLGLNWQLNPNMRVMFNYVRSMPEDEGEANIFMVRTQIDF